MLAYWLRRLAGPAMIVGGLMWIAAYAVMGIVGVMTGKMAWALPVAQQPLPAHMYYPLLYLSALPLGISLLGLFARLVGRSRVLGAIGALFGVVAIVMGLLSALGLATVANAFPGYVSALFASGFLGWAALRTGILTHSMAWTLIIIAIATVPILVVTPLPIGPDWATDALAFLLGGIGYTVVGMRMLPLGHTTSRGTTIVASRVAV